MTRGSPLSTIVVPIFNGLHVVRPCLDSVRRFTNLDRHPVTLVNDGSDEHTSETLRAWARESPGIRLMQNDRNLGFVRSCNRAVATVTTPYVILLNSDTCVTPRWADKMVACLESDPSIAVASPISNFAPHMRIEMVPGMDYVGMNALVEELTERSYPDITTPEGFCFGARMAHINELGFFDEVFDDGYGEESDLSMRANYFGLRTVCVDDTYIYHRGRGTFGRERRDALYNRNKVIFQDRWKARYPEQVAEFRARDPIGYLRTAIEGIAGSLESGYRR